MPAACSVTRLLEREAYRRLVLVASEKRLHRPRLDRAANQVVQRVPVALLERRALGLPVIGEDDDLVGARSVSAGPRDSPELLVELAERFDRVVPLETGVVRDLVVAGQRRVNGGTAAEHVRDHREDDEVAEEDAHGRTQERIGTAPCPRGCTSRRRRAAQLEDDFTDEERHGTRDVVSVRKECAVAGFALRSALILLTVRITSSAPPERRFPRLVPPSTSRPEPFVRRRSISLQSPGAEHVISVPVSFSTQRKAGMSSFEPSRIPAWLAPVWDERIGFPLDELVRAGREPACHLRCVAIAERSLKHGVGEAVDLDEDDAGPVAVNLLPERRAIRSITRSEYVSSLLTPSAIWNTSVAAAAARAPARAQPNVSTTMESLTMMAAVQRTAASRTRATRNPLRTVNGSRIRAMAGTISALRMPMTATTPNAPSTPSTRSPGSRSAAVRSPAAARVQPTSKLRRRSSGRRTTRRSPRPSGPRPWGCEAVTHRAYRALAPLGFYLQMLELTLERAVQRSGGAAKEPSDDAVV